MSQRAGSVAKSSSTTSISVAVLGPGLSNRDNPGSHKRNQIRNALQNDGHIPFFPEEFVVSDPTLGSTLERERALLSRPEVDLVIILLTPESPGAIAELAHFVTFPEIKAKTAVLSPIQYYTPDEGLVANTVREYFARMPYSESQFEACQLVSECRMWANTRATGNWPILMPQQF